MRSAASGITRSLCAPRLPEIRFVLAAMGPMPSAAQREAAARLENVVLEEYGAPARMDAGRGRKSGFEPALADAAGAPLSAPTCCTSTAMRTRATTSGLPVLAVAHSDVLSWWRAVHGEAAPPRVGAVPAGGRRRPARGRPCRRANRRRARRSGARNTGSTAAPCRHCERDRYRVLRAAAEARRDHGGRKAVGRGEKSRAARRSRR